MRLALILAFTALAQAQSVFPPASSGGGPWGSITGTLADQTDLNTALGLKAALASPTFSGTPSLPAATVLGGVSLSGLSTGMVKLTAGVPSAAVAGTDYVGGQASLTTAALIPTIASSGILTQTANFGYDASVVRIPYNAGAASVRVGGASSFPGIWLADVTPNSGNYTIGLGGGNLLLNTQTTSTAIAFRQGDVTKGILVATTSAWGFGNGNTSPTGTVHIKDATATTGATRLTVALGAADSATTVTLTNEGTTKSAGYQSSDGSAGITGSTCTAWKNGLCTSP